MKARKRSPRKPHLAKADLALRASLLRLLRKQGLQARTLASTSTHEHTKDEIRCLHSHFRTHRLSEERRFVEEWYPAVRPLFASGDEINPEKIDPYPVLVRSDDEASAALFRIAALWWSIPVSRGFGRRFRTLIFDRSNGKLFGLLGLTDPVFNLKTRDEWIGWDVRQREERLVNVMDAYVLGAVPPYNSLLGAKFVALLAASNYTRDVFKARYRDAKSVILKRKPAPRLAMVTATSALGKSSIYNRLRLDGHDVFGFVGLTRGYGHFHLANGTFSKLRDLLERHEDDEGTNYKFGAGPNYRIRVTRKALEYLNLPPELLRHGVRRAVYVAPLASNTAAFLRGEANRLLWHDRPLSAVTEFWRNRWLLPRAATNIEYRSFRNTEWDRVLGLD